MGLGGTTGGLGGVEISSRSFKRGRKALPRCPGGVERPSQRNGRGREALPVVREGAGFLHVVLERVGKPLAEVWEALPGVRKTLPEV